jgi:hypothetical protein
VTVTPTPGRSVIGLGGAVLLALWCAAPALAQSSDELQELRKEIEDLRKGQGQIQKDLHEIKMLLRGRARTPPAERPNVVVSIKDQPVKGAKDAKLTLVEFSDLTTSVRSADATCARRCRRSSGSTSSPAR